MSRKLANWLQAYGEYALGTESPDIFHMWVGIGTLMGAAQRKIYMNADYFRVYSNMYIILVSPPGRARKSTALRTGKNLLKGVLDYGEEIHFSTQASSVAALIKQMSAIKNKEHQSLTAYSSELGSLLGSQNMDMVDWLTDVFDCEPDWDKQTISRGLEAITAPWFNFIAATTPQWLGDNLPKTAVEGGFVARSVFVYSDERKLVPFPKQTAEQKELRRHLTHDLALISKIKGEITFSEEGREFYEEWYLDEKRFPQNPDYRIATYYDRKHVHLLKTAMALSIAEGDSLQLERRDLETALILLNELEPGMGRAFSAVGGNVHSTDLERISGQIERAREMTYRELIMSNIHAMPKDKIDEQLESLVSMGKVKREGTAFKWMSGEAA